MKLVLANSQEISITAFSMPLAVMVECPAVEDAYAAGDKARYNGKRWVSDISGNVWEPGVYGWTEVA